MSKATITPKLKEQIIAIRDTGATNMFDVDAVMQLAFEHNFFDLVVFLLENKQDYSDFILYGDRVEKEAGKAEEADTKADTETGEGLGTTVPRREVV